ncbi:hypothetical protein BDZ89DRAFT_946314 [Hymenopellis radicata]|nr:hypothetical protein BDZ89DRAFT_946314 [Hymenopellis radicata]
MIKVPLIISEVIGMRVSTLPPNPPPKKTQQVALTGREALVRLLMKGGPSFMRGAYLVGGVIEIVALVARIFPSWPWSSMILGVLSFSDAPDELDLYLNPFGMLGTLIATLGALLRWRCYQTLGRHFTLELSLLKDHELITSGPYSILRHPSYTGGLMTVFGAILSRGSHGSWLRESGVLRTSWGAVIVGLWVFLACGMGLGASSRVKEEDAFLKKEFGIKWDEWAARVPCRLIPGIY